MSTKSGSGRFALALILGVLLCLSSARAGGKITVVDVLSNSSGMLRLTTSFDPNMSYPNLRKFAVIAIAQGTHINSIAFDAGDWATMTVLWNKAVAAHPATWQSVGAFTDTSGADSSTLNLKAGSGVTLVLSSPTRGTVTYVLVPVDLERFGADMRKVQRSLASQNAE
jgi:hypothetical protein